MKCKSSRRVFIQSPERTVFMSQSQKVSRLQQDVNVSQQDKKEKPEREQEEVVRCLFRCDETLRHLYLKVNKKKVSVYLHLNGTLYKYWLLIISAAMFSFLLCDRLCARVKQEETEMRRVNRKHDKTASRRQTLSIRAAAWKRRLAK